MSEQISRRQVLKTGAAIGVGALLAKSPLAQAESSAKSQSSHQVTLAAGQFCSAWGKPSENLAAVARLSEKAARQGAALVLFPEDCLTGYPGAKGAAAKVALRQDGPELLQLADLARTHHIIIAAGFIEHRGNAFYSSEAIVRPDGTKTIIRKRSGDARDRRIGLIASDTPNPDFRIADATMALCICSDGTPRFFHAAKQRKVNVILHPSGGACARSVSANDPDAQRVDERERANDRRCLEAAQKRARDLDAAYCSANPVGFDGERGYPGNSFIISREGEVLAYLEGTAIYQKMKEGVIAAKVTLG